MRKVQFAQHVKIILLVGMVTVSGLCLVLVRGKAHANGGYPWSGAVCVSTGQTAGKCPNYEWSYGGKTKNPNTGNYYYRNCTDYVAWKLLSLGVSAAKISGLGSAGSWDNNAPSKGLSVTTSPSAGSVGVDERYGHVVYVESVSGSNITISEYNWGSTGSFGTRSGTMAQLGVSKFINFGLSGANNGSSVSGHGPTSVNNARFLGTDRLRVGQKMTANQYIESFNTTHVLMMQTDGNLVQYGDGFKVLWHTGTDGNPGAFAVFQTDGNLVVYAADGRPLWNSRPRYGADKVILQDDGHLVTYSSNMQPLWYTGVIVPNQLTYKGSDSLLSNQSTLWPNQFIRSKDGRYSLVMQSDGNLVLYAPGHHPIWHSHTYGSPGARFVVQGDGNIVVYSKYNQPLWSVRPQSNSARLVMQSDGNLVQYSTNGLPLWHTQTFGKL
ncbi:CHAP domain-containing protein [Candidatus Saccharibacteria bacterium]|nr:CHAP domain-containing protein [Candidatus Saccharibacteria bacterium]